MNVMGRRRRASIVRVVVTCLIGVCAILPGAFLARTVTSHWVNIPYMDQWDISHVFIHYRDGTLSWEKLIAQHNESRKLFPRLVFLGMGLMSGWDVRWEMALTMILASLISVNLLLLLRKLPPFGRWGHLVVYALVNAVLFSPVQWNNWLWGIQLVVFIPPLMLTTGLLVATSTWPLVCRAVVNSVLAFVATFSYANGMVLWVLLFPAALLGLRLSPPRRRDRPQIALVWYVLAAAVTLLVYFHDYHQPPGKPPMTLALASPAEACRYFLSWVGSPLVPNEGTLGLNLRILVGGVVVSTYLACAVSAVAARANGAVRHLYPWLVLGLYAIVSGITTTIGRLGFGIEHAADSRYTSFSLYLLVANLAMVPAVSAAPNRVKPLPRTLRVPGAAILSCTLLWLHLSAAGASQGAVKSSKASLLEGILGLELRNVFIDSGRLVLLYPNVGFLATRHGELEALGLTGARAVNPGQDWLEAGPTTQGEPEWGNLDQCQLVNPMRLHFSGWAGRPAIHAPGVNAILVYTTPNGISRPFAIRRVHLPRQEVAHMLDNPAMMYCGFGGDVDVKALPTEGVMVSAWTIDPGTDEAHQLGMTHRVVRE